MQVNQFRFEIESYSFMIGWYVANQLQELYDECFIIILVIECILPYFLIENCPFFQDSNDFRKEVFIFEKIAYLTELEFLFIWVEIFLSQEFKHLVFCPCC